MGKILMLVLISLSVCQITYADTYCKAGRGLNYTSGSAYENNLDLLFTNLNSKSLSLKFYSSTIGDSPNKMYGLFQCRNDVGLDDCSLCVEDATHRIFNECPLCGEATLWHQQNDGCMLRYAKHNIFSVPEKSPWSFRSNPENITNPTEFAPILKTTLKELNEKASSALSFFASAETYRTSVERFFSYAQCTPDLNKYDCYECLDAALSELINCCSTSKGAVVFMPSCQLRFETGPFLNETFLKEMQSLAPPGSPTSSKASLKPAILGAIAACVLVGLLVLSVILWICLCRKRPKQVISGVPPASSTGPPDDNAVSGRENIGDAEFVQYDFGTLKTATTDFSPENKLGEGGFGSVYKGTLENGELLAIKRLSGTSGQGTKEFMTEARLLAKLQHRNLVKLMGFCSEAEEKLLVYEFMSNSSLDGFLFDPRKQPLLDWSIRYKIIIGIARGLQYLHEDSRLTIIHRDLKPGNILLDKDMNPKIADFGLAKLCEAAQRFGNTSRIAGTLGYMAPEYLMTGEYSDKSDVYSFGILLLEIVSGENNIKFYKSQQKEDLPIRAWRLWNEKRSFDLTDLTLNNKISSKDVTRLIQIGLLCLQANAEERPKMALVVVMLTSSIDLPLPSAPAMSFPQFNMPMAYSGGQQSDIDQYFTKSDTVRTDVTQDLHPQPR